MRVWPWLKQRQVSEEAGVEGGRGGCSGLLLGYGMLLPDNDDVLMAIIAKA